MQNFIQGTLTDNFEGSTYQGVVYDRVLYIQTRGGKQLEINDAEGPISSLLQTGKTYRFFLSPFYLEEKDILYYLPDDNVINRAFWEGKIVDLDWRPSQSSDSYECVTARFSQTSWILIETNEGYLLLNSSVLKITPNIGGTVQFGETVFALHAAQSLEPK